MKKSTENKGGRMEEQDGEVEGKNGRGKITEK